MHQPATPAELQRHRQAVTAIRAALFKARTPGECFIVPGSEVIEPISVRFWRERLVTLGGLRYQAASPKNGYLYNVTVRHEGGPDFGLYLGVSINGALGFTRFAMSRPFNRIADQFHWMIDAARAEDSQFTTADEKVTQGK